MADGAPSASPELETAQDEQDDLPAKRRDEELSGRKKITDQLTDLYNDLERGFEDQNTRSNEQMDFWDIYNCILGPKQMYTGTAVIFVPIVHDAVNARVMRFTNQIFPQSGRYVDCTTEDGELPYGIIALLENYVRLGKMRTEVIPALMRNGDVEGHYHLYMSWDTTTRMVAQRSQSAIETDDMDTGETADDIEEIEVKAGRPIAEVIADSDVLVLPVTSSSIDDAIANGGSVTILRRWSKAKIRRMIKAGEITKKAGEDLITQMSDDFQSIGSKGKKDKKMADAAGIKIGASKHALVYETWTELKVGNDYRLCRAYFGNEDLVLGCKRNPYWCDRVPLISAPIDRIQGAFKGQSKISPVATLQYEANDAANKGADSSSYALMPIVMTDPQKNPRIGSMVLSMAAIWETSPNDTSFAKFPELWQDALQLVAAHKSQIFQTLSVNPSFITQGSSSGAGSKQNQAEIANEQQIDVMATADAVTVLEEGILTPYLNWCVWLDHQFREDEVTVRQYGEMGQRVTMEHIPPIQFDRRYQFTWFGVEQARSAQRIQSQIAYMNVLRGIPPEQLNGYKLNLVPLITQGVENVFGPRLSPLIFESPEDQMPVDPNQENMLLAQGFSVPVHEMDDDQQHVAVHMQLLQSEGVTNKKKTQVHIFEHMQQGAKKQQLQQQAAQGQPGIPGGAMGGQAQPGVAGTPRIGAQPGQVRGGQGPAGMIHQDQLQDPSKMPRNMG